MEKPPGDGLPVVKLGGRREVFFMARMPHRVPDAAALSEVARSSSDPEAIPSSATLGQVASLA